MAGPAVALLALACLLTVSVARARAGIAGFGVVTGRDLKQLKRGFLAEHPRGYRIAGYHASVLYEFRFAGVYYLRRKGGVFVDSGVAIFRRTRGGWRADRHPSRAVERNLEPYAFFYTAHLSGSGTYRLLEETGIDEPETREGTRTEIQLALMGVFGAGRDKLVVEKGEEEPEPAAPHQLIGGNGTSAHTDAARPEEDYSCSFQLLPSEDETSLSIGWHGTELDAVLDLGSPFGSAPGPQECGGRPEDPVTEDPWLEVHAKLAHPPIGKPFDVPVELEHQRSYPGYNEETGALTSLEERALSLHGTLHFTLVGVEPPALN
jgi:hypothetical protein